MVKLLKTGIALVFLTLAIAGCRTEDGVRSLGGRYGRYINGGRFVGCNPTMSPDGKYVAFSTPISGNGDIYLFEIASGSFRQLTISALYEGDPSWNSRSDGIVFTREDGRGAAHIWELDITNREECQVTFGRNYDHAPRLTHNDSELLFSREYEGAGISNYVMSQVRSGTSKKDLVSVQPKKLVHGCCQSPLPTGETVYIRNFNQIRIFDPIAKSDESLCEGWDVATPSEDPKAVFYLVQDSNYNVDVWQIDIDSLSVSQLTNLSSYLSELNVEPSGMKMTFLSEKTRRGVGEVMVFDIESRSSKHLFHTARFKIPE